MSDEFHKEIALGFLDGKIVIHPEGEGPAACMLTADLSGREGNWRIAAVYLADLDHGNRQELTGDFRDLAEMVLIDDYDFRVWADRNRRNLANFARQEYERDLNPSPFADLHAAMETLIGA